MLKPMSVLCSRMLAHGLALAFGMLPATLIVPVALAQTETASIGGRVTDASGAVVPEADIQIKNVQTNAIDQTKTNRDGLYIFASLKPGSYVVTVGKPGFRTVNLTGLTLYTEDKVSRNFTLSVGAVSESITVSATAEHLETDNPAVGLLVPQTFVENTPLNGRSFQDLIALAPGVVASQTGSDKGEGLFNVNGQRGDANYFMVDGVSANTSSGAVLQDYRGLSGAIPAQTALGTTQSLISVDALQEFKIQTSGYSADNGRQPGGQVQLTSRSGTNTFHGTLFDFFRNEALDANSWSNNNAVPRIRKQAERQNDFGGTLGGPVIIPGLFNGKNRTFFFVSYEGLRLRLPTSIDVIVPTVAFRQFAPPAFQPFLNAYPLPTGPDLADPCAAAFNPTDTFPCSAFWRSGLSYPSSLHSLSIRGDQTIGDHLQLFARYSDTPSQTSTLGVISQQRIVQNASSWTLGATWRISQFLLDDVRFNKSDNDGNQATTPMSLNGGTAYSKSLLAPPQYSPASSGGAAIEFILPDPATGTLDFLSQQYLNNVHLAVHQYNVVNTTEWSHGRHIVKVGEDFRRLHSLFGDLPYYAYYGVFSLSTFTTSTADVAFVTAQRQGLPTFTNLSIYAQDTWKATPRLTVDYGVRWEFNPAPGAVDGVYPLALTSSNLATTEIAPAGTPQYHNHYDHFAPRVGFSYELNSSPHLMVVRGGYGIFYDTGQNWGAVGYLGYPFSNTNMLANFPFPISNSAAELAPPSLNGPLTKPYQELFLNAPNLTLPYTEQWNLTLSAGLRRTNTATISYVGNAGKKLLFSPFYGDLSTVNPAFTQMQITTNGSSSTYNGLQVQDQGYVARGLQVIASYTWSHAIDNVSGDTNPNSPIRGTSDNDVRQVFNVGLNYGVPGIASHALLRGLTGGWSFDGRFTAQTGNAFSVIQNCYLMNPGQLTSCFYPDLAPNVPAVLHSAPGAAFGWSLNPAAFIPVPVNPDGSPVRFGGEPRNLFHGPGFWNLNMAAQREFRIWEQLHLMFRIEAFNMLNHPNGGIPNTCLCDGPSFGLITGGINSFGVPNQLYATGSARSLQLALKLKF